jgi:sulfite reductase (NADPH) flavoprotein alpha-component
MSDTSPSSPVMLPNIVVGFASQTGTAMRIAQHLSDQLSTVPELSGIPVSTLCLNRLVDNIDSHFTSPVCTYMVLVASSFGKGDPPMNGQKFDKYVCALRKASNPFKNAKFAVLGIGNSLFPIYCGFTKRMDSVLEKLGALRINERFDGDSGNPKK